MIFSKKVIFSVKVHFWAKSADFTEKSDLLRSGPPKDLKYHWLNNVLSQLRISCIFRIKLLCAPKILFKKYFSRSASATRSKKIIFRCRPVQSRTGSRPAGTFYERHFAGERQLRPFAKKTKFTLKSQNLAYFWLFHPKMHFCDTLSRMLINTVVYLYFWEQFPLKSEFIANHKNS